MKKFNLKLFNFKITKAQGGSLRVYASKNPIEIKKIKINKQINKEKNIYKLFKMITYKKFEKKIINCKINLQKILKKLEQKKLNVAGYGAAAKTTTFLYYFELSKNNQIKYIFDDNSLKQGLYLPGTTKKILNPKYLSSKKVNVLILFAWNYSDIIIKNIRNNKMIEKKGLKFLIPFPKPKII